MLGVLVTLAAVGGRSAGADVLASSTFDSSSESWTIADLVNPPSQNPPAVSSNPSISYQDHGGDPDGYVSFVDNDSDFWFFSAPAAFLGNKSAAYGGALTFDESTSTSGGASGSFAITTILVGGGLTISREVSEPEPIEWTSFSAPLSGSDWVVNFSGTASQPQIQQVLSDLTNVYISGDWAAGIETTTLDNVSITAVPEPASVGLLGTAGLALLRRRSRHTETVSQ